MFNKKLKERIKHLEEYSDASWKYAQSRDRTITRLQLIVERYLREITRMNAALKRKNRSIKNLKRRVRELEEKRKSVDVDALIDEIMSPHNDEYFTGYNFALSYIKDIFKRQGYKFVKEDTNDS